MSALALVVSNKTPAKRDQWLNRLPHIQAYLTKHRPEPRLVPIDSESAVASLFIGAESA